MGIFKGLLFIKMLRMIVRIWCSQVFALREKKERLVANGYTLILGLDWSEFKIIAIDLFVYERNKL
jgi:hypothetical protein